MQPLNLFYEIVREYQANQYCDLDLCGGSDDIQKITPIRCHKLVMCSLVPEWLRLVDEDTDRIHLPDVEHSDLKRLIDGLYAQLAKKHDSWDHFDPALLAFLSISHFNQKREQDSRWLNTHPLAQGNEGIIEDGHLLVSLGGIKDENDWNLKESASLWDVLSPNQEPSDPLEIGGYLKQDELTVELTDISERKRKHTEETTTENSKAIELSENFALLKKSRTESSSDPRTFVEQTTPKNKKTKLVSKISANPSTNLKRLRALKKNMKSIEATQQNQTIDFERIQYNLQNNAPSTVHVDVTTSSLTPTYQHLAHKSLTIHQDAFFALVGIQRRGSDILGRTLAFTTQDVEAINASFSPAIDAFMKVFGFARVQLLSAKCFWTRNGSIAKTTRKHFVNDLHRKFRYKCTRKELENELNQPEVVQGLSTFPPTRKDIPLPIAKYGIYLTNDPLDYDDIIILGVHKHGVEARQFVMHNTSEEFVAHYFSRVLTLIWVGGNGQAVFPPCNEILQTNCVNIRLNYTFKTITKFLASDENFPRALPVVTCEICGKQIQENVFMNNFILHKKAHIKQQMKNKCDMHFTSFSLREKPSEECKMGKRLPKIAQRHQHQSLICDACGKRFTSKLAMWHHTRSAHQNITCQSCNEKFSTALAYKKHLKHNHTAQEVDTPVGWLRCSECNEIFSSKSDLSKHWKQCHGSEKMRPFKCGLCSKSFIEKPKLKYHVLSAHIKSRPYKCRKEGCSSTFNYCGNLYAHEKKLHGVRLGPGIPLDDLVSDSQLLEMGCLLKPPPVP